ncbi:PREDICTED: immunoglobulin superfamily containing leucine-rich repeat protein-like [Priapulus caudatus]|uniref:Immunoglobulin superfamily containing leucine-rich repeat protein-like n=1 Tax=Priapulus caudatus TaxID=37621 RepID=A0ABM1F555_PRICU|nr:PREDICTED: immunoglobulin superfamily containing leucine-rich repeat protein-like [Priapulus caudatus]
MSWPPLLLPHLITASSSSDTSSSSSDTSSSLRRCRLVLVLVLLLLQHTSVATCPRHCECIVRTNQLSVDCRAAGYTRVPPDLPADTLVLNMDDNSVATLRADSFRAAPNLQQVSLARCGLRDIEPGALAGFRNVKSLLLGGNALREVPAAALRGLPNLKTLSLDGNPLGALVGSPFASLRKLTRLELGGCGLREVGPEAFAGLDNVNFLSLRDNELTTLSLATFLPLEALLQLDVHRNPLRCDCSLRPLVDWAKRRRVGFGASPTCAEPPRARAADWDRMTLLDFACAPTVRMAALSASDVAVRLRCSVSADPRATVLWYRNGVVVTDLFLNYTISRDSYSTSSSSSSSSSSRSNGDVGDRHSVLTVYGTPSDVYGEYVCYAENPGGAANASLVHRHDDEPRGEVATVDADGAVEELLQLPPSGQNAHEKTTTVAPCGGGLRRTLSVPGGATGKRYGVYLSDISNRGSARPNHVTGGGCSNESAHSPRTPPPRRLNNYDANRIYDASGGYGSPATAPPLGKTRVKYCLETDL